ncbi:host-nuclease inhibitor Gam family protein [Candidatus Desantisbacteria bacterium]|nr:host-nuclease inhibitor Gam family protein [Candidatus Desantisbacteria bacterium]
MSTLIEIEKQTCKYAEIRLRLKEEMTMTEARINTIKNETLPKIKKVLTQMVEAESQLKSMMEDSKDSFDKPRTYIFHGIKVGFQKLKGKILWDDDDTVIKLIRKHFPDKADTMIRTLEVPNKQVLSDLPVHDLKKIGVVVTETSDEIIIKSTDSAIDKMINALMKDLEKIEDAA